MVQLSDNFHNSWLDKPAVVAFNIDAKEKESFNKNEKLNTFKQSVKSRVYQVGKTVFDLSIKPITKLLDATKNIGVGVVKLGIGIPVGIVSPKSDMAKNGIKSISKALDTLISCVAGIGKTLLFNPIDIIAPELQVGTRIDNQFARVSQWRTNSQKEEKEEVSTQKESVPPSPGVSEGVSEQTITQRGVEQEKQPCWGDYLETLRYTVR